MDFPGLILRWPEGIVKCRDLLHIVPDLNMNRAVRIFMPGGETFDHHRFYHLAIAQFGCAPFASDIGYIIME
jgi:hypothetical protein